MSENAHQAVVVGKALLRREGFLAFSVATVLVFSSLGHRLLADLSNPVWFAFIFLWLFSTILGSALAVVRHADRLAVRLGEPYGTLILTLSVTSIEVMSITAVMMHGENNPTLARDTLFSVIMIIFNGMVGLSILMGSWRHREQHHNLQGANAYLGVIIPLAVLSLVLPSYTRTTPDPTLSVLQEIFVVLTTIGLYAAFLGTQAGRHRSYFTLDSEPEEDPVAVAAARSLLPSVLLLAAYMAPVVFLAEQLAHPVDYVIETLGMPTTIAGVVMAVLVATPEAISAVRAAMANHLQRSINIFLGSVLSTIGLTIPAMMIVSYLIGRNIILGLQGTDLVMLLLTLAVSIVTFASGRTHILQGIVHMILFAAFLLLIFQN
ncbi:calcium:proton antiporter [Rhizobium sp. BK251]|uniref:calcium:proton antiporter n=1 Tax=Rhizobium sp. BK251 TaxID=2512125 RepID=UPI001053D976|nr:calcium:proton antiporter [Rhizobium sp. BK251]TCL69842.1 Ca2+:H+ antiporter [Rhizobium sp. BK251]